MTRSLFPTDLSGEPLAILSPCGLYRYMLRRGGRVHGGEGIVNFILLNPSTADATLDDPTVRRCAGYARAWDYDDLVITNLFAFRSTAPEALRTAADPIGPDNDGHLIAQARRASMVVCGWGAHGVLHGRAEAVMKLLTEAGIRPHYLTLTNAGQPGHPLYLSGSLTPTPFLLPEGRPRP